MKVPTGKDGLPTKWGNVKLVLWLVFHIITAGIFLRNSKLE